jgi:hypothetical protein
MGVEGNAVLGLAGFDATQATDAAGGIHAERPAVFGPVVVRRWKSFRGCRLPLIQEARGAQKRANGYDGLSDHAKKCAAFGLGLACFSLHDLVPP